MRAEASHQSKRYYKLWSAHGEVLEEVQILRSQVMIVSSSGRVDNAGGWLESTSRDPRG